MAILTVGPTSSFPTIAAAMLAAGPADTILLEAGYSNETATVTQNGMTVFGDATSTGIVLQLASTPTIATFFLTGTAPINVLDAADADGNGITGNDGNNVITVSDGQDAVNGGLGIDRLIVNYQLATGAVTGDSTSNFSEAAGRLVTITNGTFEHFTVTTGPGADTITTGDGDDIISTGEGAGTITAGQGANIITGGSGADTITALDGGNIIEGGDGTNTITSGGGIDVITTGVGADTIVAGGGNDVITVRGGADTVNSGAEDDRLVVDYSAFTTAVIGGVTGGNLGTGYTGHIADLTVNTVDFVETENFTITTGSGNDVITTGGGIDVITTGGGNDTLRGGAGNDALNGGSGDDTAVFSGATANYTIVQNNNGTLTVTDNRLGSPDGTDTLTAIEHLQFSDIIGNTINGTAGNDTIDATHTPVGQQFPSNLVDIINGLAGNDKLSGLGGDDQLFGGDGSDTLTGGAGNDLHDGGIGADKMIGGLGNDTYLVDNIGDKITELAGAGTGTDQVQSSVTYTLAANVENLELTGTALNGTGNASANAIMGNSGDNTLAGLGGADTFDGVSGNDTLSYAASKAGVNVSLQTHAVSGGDAAGDTFGNIDNLIGSSKNDILEGDANNNTLNGGSGIDTVSYANASAGVTVNLATAGTQNTVGAGTDTLSLFENVTGSSHNDTLTGNTGNNLFIGGEGNDTMTGGAGKDVFWFDGDGALFGNDTVTDFVAGQDKLSLDHNFFNSNNLPNLQQQGSDVLFDFGDGNSITFQNHLVADLHIQDVLFH